MGRRWLFPVEGLRRYLAEGDEASPGEGQAQVLRHLQHEYAMLLDSLSDGYGVLCDGRLVVANSRGLAGLGYALHEALGKPFAEMLAPEERAKAAEAYARVMSGGQVEQPYQTVMLCKDGSRYPVEGTFTATSYRGRPAIAILIRDVTRRVEAQKRLEESQRFSALLLDSIVDFVTVQDTEFNIIRVNRTTEAVFGKDLVGRKCYVAYQGRREVCPDCPMAKSLATGKPAFSTQLAPSGTTVEIWASPVKDGAGKIIAMIEHGRDVTARRQAEEAILRRNRELSVLNAIASVLNESPQIARALGVALGRVMGILEMPLGLAYLVDRERGELVLQAARGLRAEFLEEILRVDIGAGMIGAVPLSPGPIIASDYAGDPRLFCTTILDAEHLRSFAGFALKAGEEVVGAICLGSRETRAVSAPELELLDTIGKQLGAAIGKERLVRAAAEMDSLSALDALKSQLLSVVSHELRTPLASIKGYATLMLRFEDRIDSAERREYLAEIDRSTDRLGELIGHLLDVSRLDAGLLRLEKVSADVVALVDESVANARRKSPGRTFNTRIADDLPRISLDRRRIRQVLDNILDNAVKYSTEGTEITIGGRLHDGYVEVSVTDRGVGIAQTDLERVFERMYRVEQKTPSQVGGVGLGLAISKGLVEAHGGRIWAESQVGQGSTFHVALPARET